MQNHQAEHFTNHQHFEPAHPSTAPSLPPPSYEDHMRHKESSINNTHPPPPLISPQNPKVNVIVTTPSKSTEYNSVSDVAMATPQNAATANSPNKSPAASVGSGGNSLSVSSCNNTPATSPRPSPNITPLKVRDY